MEKLNTVVITDVKLATTIDSPKGRKADIKKRYYNGLSFCLGGQITYFHKGNKYVSDSSHAVFLPRGETYSLYCDKGGMFPLIDFCCNDMLFDTIKVLPIKNKEVFLNDYEQIKQLLLFDGNRAKIISIFYNIIHQLYTQNKGNTILSPAIHYYIEENYADTDLTNEMLAKKCYISEVYFRKLFLNEYKVSPKQFIINLRINKAKQLLTEGILKINAVSQQCGFSNPYHFCRIFKDKTGLTPTEYQKQNNLHLL